MSFNLSRIVADCENVANMARCQTVEKWLLLLFVSSAPLLCSCCHPTSKKLHICLNIYLERDFFHVETLVQSQDSVTNHGYGRFYVEGPELDSICKDFAGLSECYEDLAGECDTYWKLARYVRVLNLMTKTHQYLCGNNSKTGNLQGNLQDLLVNAPCLRSAHGQLSTCSDRGGFQWSTTWKEILRLQVDSVDRCPAIDRYGSCMMDKLKQYSCGQEASLVYAALFDVWLEEWCNRNGLYMSYFYLPLRLLHDSLLRQKNKRFNTKLKYSILKQATKKKMKMYQ